MRVINFQLDSADPLFIYSHLDQLPFLASKIQSGTSGVLFCHGSSAISWTSFWTGRPPYAHGILGFWNDVQDSRIAQVARLYTDSPGQFLHRSSKPVQRALKRILLMGRTLLVPAIRLYLRSLERSAKARRRPNNRTDVRCPMGYEIMERAKLRVGLVNSIYTYPTWEINGYVVCDWTMPVEASNYYHPAELGAYLEEIGYLQTLDTFKQYWGWLEGSMSDDVDAIYFWATELFEKVKQITIHLLKTRPGDFHTTMFRYLDTMQHVFIDDPERMLAAYKLVDSGLAEIAESTGLDQDDVCWLLNSDHGMTQFWNDRTIKGGHDLAGFYCFAKPGLFRLNHRYTLHIEDLMPVILHLYGIESIEIPFSQSLGEYLFVQEDMSAVQERLRALGYL